MMALREKKVLRHNFFVKLTVLITITKNPFLLRWIPRKFFSTSQTNEDFLDFIGDGVLNNPTKFQSDTNFYTFIHIYVFNLIG